VAPLTVHSNTAPRDVAAGVAATDEERRYVQGIIAVHDRMTYGRLPEQISGGPVHVHESGDGLLTLAVRDSQLPHRYLLGLFGFRLAQYLQLGWVSQPIVYRNALFHEPLRPAIGQDDIHIVSLCLATGRIRGYAALAGSRDPGPLPLDGPGRTRLSVEKDHKIDLMGPYAAEGWTTHQVYEAKRLLRDQTMPRGELGERVPWHVLMAWGRALMALEESLPHVLVAGDAKESGSLRHVRRMGFRLDVVEGTSPGLPKTDLLWPIFVTDEQAKPFVGRLGPDFARRMDTISAFLARPLGSEPVSALLGELS
jgi:hypothetical protein